MKIRVEPYDYGLSKCLTVPIRGGSLQPMAPKCAYVLQGTPPEFKFRNFWWYQLKPEVELERFSLPEVENGNDAVCV